MVFARLVFLSPAGIRGRRGRTLGTLDAPRQTGPGSERPPVTKTLTLRNLPSAVYQRLNASAEASRRSINSEAILCLQSALAPEEVKVAERLKRARAVRSRIGPVKPMARGMTVRKRDGRK